MSQIILNYRRKVDRQEKSINAVSLTNMLCSEELIGNVVTLYTLMIFQLILYFVFAFYIFRFVDYEKISPIIQLENKYITVFVTYIYTS